jgi:hypothetical protein
MEPQARMVFTVIGRYCPWEIVHYAGRGRFRRATVRFSRGVTPVGMNGRTIWTRYYRPGEFAARFEASFRVVGYEAMSVFVPPPYLTFLYDRARPVHRLLERLDTATTKLPQVRELGDHFLMVLERR